jgi:tetratricopeptide (TPR) repeat protein
MQSKYYVSLAIIVGLVIGIGGWLLLGPKQAIAPSSTATSTGTAATSTATTTLVDLGNGQYLHVPAGATVTEQDVTVHSAPTPPAMPALAFSADLNADAKQALQIQWNTLTSQLKTAPTRTDLHLELGTTYKIAGQYDAAISQWNYVGKYGPSTINYVAYGNLGDLYLNFLHDYVKAAASYKLALKGAPGNADYQAGLKAAQSHL